MRSVLRPCLSFVILHALAALQFKIFMCDEFESMTIICFRVVVLTDDGHETGHDERVYRMLRSGLLECGGDVWDLCWAEVC